MATVRLSVGRATDSHVAGAGHQVRSPAPDPCDSLYPPLVDGHAAHGLRVLARRTHAQHLLGAPESQSETLVIHYHLKSPAQRHVRAVWGWSSEGSWLGVRVWAGGREHVGAVERGEPDDAL